MLSLYVKKWQHTQRGRIMSKVLLIDDSVTIHRVIDLSIDADRFDITKVFSCEDAKPKLTDSQYSYILLDNKLDGLNVNEYVASLRESQPRAAIILLVGAFDKFDEADLVDSKADDFLIKPFDSQTLNKKLESAQELLPPEEPEPAPMPEPEPEPAPVAEPEPQVAPAPPVAEPSAPAVESVVPPVVPAPVATSVVSEAPVEEAPIVEPTPAPVIEAPKPVVEEVAEAPAPEHTPEPVAQPVIEKPVVEQPPVPQPVVQEPITNELPVEDQAIEGIDFGIPLVDEPTTEEPMPEQPTIEEPVMEQLNVETLEDMDFDMPVAEGSHDDIFGNINELENVVEQDDDNVEQLTNFIDNLPMSDSMRENDDIEVEPVGDEFVVQGEAYDNVMLNKENYLSSLDEEEQDEGAADDDFANMFEDIEDVEPIADIENVGDFDMDELNIADGDEIPQSVLDSAIDLSTFEKALNIITEDDEPSDEVDERSQEHHALLDSFAEEPETIENDSAEVEAESPLNSDFMNEIFSEEPAQADVEDAIKSVVADVTKEQLTSLVRQVIDADMLKDVVRDVLSEVIKEAVAEVVPQLAEKHIKEELERLMNDE